METEETTQVKEAVTILSSYLDLTGEQTEKLKKFISESTPKDIEATLELDTDEHGHVEYSKDIPVITPLYLKGYAKILAPKEGTWNVTAYLNGTKIFEKNNVHADEVLNFGGSTKWGKNNVKVVAQWSLSKKTHAKILIHI